MDKKISAMTHDISESGAFIDVSKDLIKGQEYSIGIYFSNVAVAKCSCKVVRRGTGRNGKEGTGIHFYDLKAPYKQVLKTQLAALSN